jgi:PKD repeat protein
MAASQRGLKRSVLMLLLVMLGGVALLQATRPSHTRAQSTLVRTNGPYSGVVGQPIFMSGSFTLTGVTAVQWLWSFGDGTSGSGQTVQKVYNAPGTYFVTLQVQTSQGTASAITSATITGQITGAAAGLVSAGGPYSGTAGQPITMTGSVSLAGVVPTQWLWSFGDGTSGSGQTVQKTYAAAGTYTVTLQMQTSQGFLSASTTATITATGSTSATTGAISTVSLPSGCTNVAATWPDGTPVATLVAAVSPSSAVVSVWRSEAGTQSFAAYSPSAPQTTSNLTTVNRFEAVYICTTAPATLTRPAI